MAKGGKAKGGGRKIIDALRHEQASRKNIPTAELQSFAEQMEERAPVPPVRFARARPLPDGEARERDADLDPQIVWRGVRIRLSKEQVRQLGETGEVEVGDAQLVWRGKDRQDWSDLVVQAPPLYIQEKVHPKAIIDDLVRRSKAAAEARTDAPDLFADFNGIDPEAKTEFYLHDQNWSNRMILGDSLHVMASLATREGLKGKVQCIYIDPPYGIKFNSNWQVSTQSRDVKDGKREDISREPEQVKAFRDTWKDGIHTYLTYLRDRLTVARELLTESGSIFVQIGDENVHRVRALMDEVFGEENAVSLITFVKTTGQTDNLLASVSDYVLWYSRSFASIKYRQLFSLKTLGGEGALAYENVWDGARSGASDTPLHFTTSDLTSQSPGTRYDVEFRRERFFPKGYWKTEQASFPRLIKSDRIAKVGVSLRYVRFLEDYPVFPMNNNWSDTGVAGFARLGPLPIVKAKMNPDLHMGGELKNTGKGNLFVVFGEADIDIEEAGGGDIRVRVKGIDVFDPNTGEIRSGGKDSIAAWFVDTDYDEENFFVRHAYFLGANDPYEKLRTALRAEIDREVWDTLYRDVSRPFPRPEKGRIAVKVINHFGDEVMKVFGV